MPPEFKTEALDEHLKEVVHALHGAVNSAVPHVRDDQKSVDQAVQDCGKILEMVMVGLQ